jgi:hypothetical protein
MNETKEDEVLVLYFEASETNRKFFVEKKVFQQFSEYYNSGWKTMATRKPTKVNTHQRTKGSDNVIKLPLPTGNETVPKRVEEMFDLLINYMNGGSLWKLASYYNVIKFMFPLSKMLLMDKFTEMVTTKYPFIEVDWIDVNRVYRRVNTDEYVLYSPEGSCYEMTLGRRCQVSECHRSYTFCKCKRIFMVNKKFKCSMDDRAIQEVSDNKTVFTELQDRYGFQLYRTTENEVKIYVVDDTCEEVRASCCAFYYENEIYPNSIRGKFPV